MDIIKKLNGLRLERNLSVYRLSELSGINQSTLANTFSRGIVPSIDNLSKMCEVMGITLSQFFANEETAEVLPAQEVDLLKKFRLLPQKTKQDFLNLIADVAVKSEY